MQKAPILKDGVVLVAICLIVGGAVLAWWMQTSTHSLTATTGPAVQEPVSPPPPPPRPAVRPKPAPAPVVEAAPVVVAPVVVAAAPAVQRDPLPFPVVSQIPTGVQEDSITDKYGDPSISAVTSTGGHVVETIVYAKDRGHSATVIQLEDGKVATAYSQSERIMPPGLSAPRRWHNQ